MFERYRQDEGALLIVHRFVREGEEDRVVDVIRALADECKAGLLRESEQK